MKRKKRYAAETGLMRMLQTMHESAPIKESWQTFLKGDRVKKLIEANRLFSEMMRKDVGKRDSEYLDYLRANFTPDELQVKVTKDRGVYLAYKPIDPMRTFIVGPDGVCTEQDMLHKAKVIGNILEENREENR